MNQEGFSSGYSQGLCLHPHEIEGRYPSPNQHGKGFRAPGNPWKGPPSYEVNSGRDRKRNVTDLRQHSGGSSSHNFPLNPSQTFFQDLVQSHQRGLKENLGSGGIPPRRIREGGRLVRPEGNTTRTGSLPSPMRGFPNHGCSGLPGPSPPSQTEGKVPYIPPIFESRSSQAPQDFLAQGNWRESQQDLERERERPQVNYHGSKYSPPASRKYYYPCAPGGFPKGIPGPSGDKGRASLPRPRFLPHDGFGKPILEEESEDTFFGIEPSSSSTSSSQAEPNLFPETYGEEVPTNRCQIQENLERWDPGNQERETGTLNHQEALGEPKDQDRKKGLAIDLRQQEGTQIKQTWTGSEQEKQLWSHLSGGGGGSGQEQATLLWEESYPTIFPPSSKRRSAPARLAQAQGDQGKNPATKPNKPDTCPTRSQGLEDKRAPGEAKKEVHPHNKRGFPPARFPEMTSQFPEKGKSAEKPGQRREEKEKERLEDEEFRQRGPIFAVENGKNANYLDQFKVIENLFTPEECARVLQQTKEVPFREAVVGTDQRAKTVQKIRRSQVKWIPKTADFFWIYDRCKKAIEEANEELWFFKLQGWRESLQLGLYDAKEEGHYSWHVDCGSHFSSNRKVSLSVQLSKPEDYEGGDMQFLIYSDPVTLTKRQGTAVVFPSFMVHRVTPVTKGKRYSLVIWVAGPAFC